MFKLMNEVTSQKRGDASMPNALLRFILIRIYYRKYYLVSQ